MYSNKFSTTSSLGTRYCDQDDFNIIVCGGEYFNGETISVVNEVYSVDVGNNYSVSKLAPMIEGRKDFEAVCIKNEIYVIGGKNHKGFITSIEKYSPDTNTWEEVADMHVKCTDDYCACSFMGDIYIIGGSFSVTTRSCVKFNVNDKSWKEVADMQGGRKDAACAVFEGKVSVSGGINNGRILNTVEVYDHVDDSWSYLPNMNVPKVSHKSVAVSNKLFVVGVYVTNCEVYDSTCKKFVFLKQPQTSLMDYLNYPPTYLTSIGSKLIVITNESDILLYDMVENEWSKKHCKAIKGIVRNACAKLPHF